MGLLSKLFLVTLFFQSCIALAFPQNVRLGYLSCQTCHVSPTGGGVLTPYGKSTGPELSTWGEFVDQGKSNVILGGDMRYIWLKQGDFEDRFLMQADLELGYRYKAWAGVAQYGIYHAYPEDKEASYKHYIMYNFRNATLRVGKFSPAFGLGVDDHTLPGRSQTILRGRNPSYNSEISITSKRFAFSGAWIHGCQGPYVDKERDQYCKQGSIGLTSHISWLPSRATHVALSMAHLANDDSIDTLAAFSTVLGTKHYYFMGEYVKSFNDRAEGYETIRTEKDEYWADAVASYGGFDAGLTYRSYQDRAEQGLKLRWLPTAGLELIATCLTLDNGNQRILAMGHVYF